MLSRGVVVPQRQARRAAAFPAGLVGEAIHEAVTDRCKGRIVRLFAGAMTSAPEIVFFPTLVARVMSGVWGGEGDDIEHRVGAVHDLRIEGHVAGAGSTDHADRRGVDDQSRPEGSDLGGGLETSTAAPSCPSSHQRGRPSTRHRSSAPSQHSPRPPRFSSPAKASALRHQLDAAAHPEPETCFPATTMPTVGGEQPNLLC